MNPGLHDINRYKRPRPADLSRWRTDAGGGPQDAETAPLAVADVMDRQPPVVQAQTPIRSLVEDVQRQPSRSSCVVLVEAGAPLGILGQGDLVKYLAESLNKHGSLDRPASEALQRPLFSIAAANSCADAAELLHGRGLDQLAVVDDAGTLAGLVDREAVLRAQLRNARRECRSLSRRARQCSQRLRLANGKLKVLAMQDSLLKIGNRRAMEADIRSTHVNALRYRHPYSLGLLDVDFFKSYNDHYGHLAGDRALISVAECIKRSLRGGDRVYRYGGEEFVILMPETDEAAALEAVRRLIRNLASLNIQHAAAPKGHLTLSGGVSSFDGSQSVSDWRLLFDAADVLLYRAKARGRDQVCAGSPLPESAADRQAFSP